MFAPHDHSHHSESSDPTSRRRESASSDFDNAEPTLEELGFERGEEADDAPSRYPSWLRSSPDEVFMRTALQAAKEAWEQGEVPVGVVIVHPEIGLIAKAYNQKETLRDATAHAEILAIGQASEELEAWRLEQCVMYSTLEPCPMCAGAIIQARIPRLVYGARDPKGGAAGSVVSLFEPGLFNHDVEVVEGILEDECGEILTEFFREQRQKKGSPEGPSGG